MILILFVMGLGLIIGSFLNVVIIRTPQKKSIVFPGSCCPKCNGTIYFYDNIPILSYLFLRGRCRHCKTKISIQYPFVEFLNAAGYILIFKTFTFSPATIVYSILCSALIVITFIDLEHMIIPDVITLPGIAAGLILGPMFLGTGLYNSLIGTVLGAFLFIAANAISLILLKKAGMGGGDVKMIAMLGAFMGWQKVLMIIMLSATLGSIIGISIMIATKNRNKGLIPYGPYLSLAAFITIVKGNELLNWYVNMLAGQSIMP